MDVVRVGDDLYDLSTYRRRADAIRECEKPLGICDACAAEAMWYPYDVPALLAVLDKVRTERDHAYEALGRKALEDIETPR